MNKEIKFITFEGGEGCGKTTQSKKLKEYLDTKNIPSIHTREIGGTSVGEKIRELMLHNELHSLSDLMLIMAARIEHVNNIIIPALLEGKWVVCDRYIDSTICYQTITATIENPDINNLKLIEANIYNLHNLIVEPLFNRFNLFSIPNRTFFLNISPEVGLLRNRSRTDNNKFEAQTLEFHKTVNMKFINLAKNNKKRIKTINVQNLTIDQIHNLILDHLNI